jgi:hypothetical protein
MYNSLLALWNRHDRQAEFRSLIGSSVSYPITDALDRPAASLSDHELHNRISRWMTGILQQACRTCPIEGQSACDHTWNGLRKKIYVLKWHSKSILCTDCPDSDWESSKRWDIWVTTWAQGGPGLQLAVIRLRIRCEATRQLVSLCIWFINNLINIIFSFSASKSWIWLVNDSEGYEPELPTEVCGCQVGLSHRGLPDIEVGFEAVACWTTLFAPEKWWHSTEKTWFVCWGCDNCEIMLVRGVQTGGSSSWFECSRNALPSRSEDWASRIRW